MDKLFLKRKDGSGIYKIYDIKYDKSSYPHFLIYEHGEWKVISAKHFEPMSTVTYDA